MKKITPLKAIKKKCRFDCCVNDRISWVDCSITNCSLWNFRFGTKEIPEKYKKEIKQAH